MLAPALPSLLVEVDEMTVPEAADALELPLNTAYSRLRAARFAFDQALARDPTARERRRIAVRRSVE